MKIKIIVLIVGFCILTPLVKAQDKVCVYLFYGQTCPHCVEEKIFLDGLKTKYPELEVHEFEIYYDSQNRQLYENLLETYKISTSGVPVTFIGEKAFIGFAEGDTEIIDPNSKAYVGYSGVIEKTIKDYFDTGGVDCPSSSTTTTISDTNEENNSILWVLIIPVIVIVGLITYKLKLFKIEVDL